MNSQPLHEEIVALCAPADHQAEKDIVRLVDDHRGLSMLCDMLECCADDLPSLPPRPVMEQICSALTQLCEEAGPVCAPYPEMLELYDSGDPLAAILMEQVHARRLAAATHAQDLVDALRGDLDVTERLSSTTLGYMLRCFFEGCRQAMDCEELAILTLARHRLSSAVRSKLIDSLRMRAHDRRHSIA